MSIASAAGCANLKRVPVTALLLANYLGIGRREAQGLLSRGAIDPTDTDHLLRLRTSLELSRQCGIEKRLLFSELLTLAENTRRSK